MRIRGENPVYKRATYDVDFTDRATYTGVVTKTIFLLALAAGVAFYFANFTVVNMSFPAIIATLIICPIFAFIMVIMAHKQTEIAWIYAIVYALLEGAFLGLISLLVTMQVGFDGVVYALLGTFGTTLFMLLIYSTGIINITNRVKAFLTTALISLIGVSILFFILYSTGIISGELSMGFYLTIVVVSVLLAAFYLLYDFKVINEHVEAGASKNTEWSLSLGLMVTIVWLYIDLLRLVYYVLDRN